MQTYKCKICGHVYEYENEQDWELFGEEEMWGHIEHDHEEKFNEVQNWETPDMIDEFYTKISEKELSWVRNEGNIKYVINTAYSEESDMTFIIENKYVNDECLADPLVSEEVVGFIHGNVSDINVIKQHYRELKAEFHDEYYTNIMLMLADIRDGIAEMGNDNQDILNSHFTLKWSLNGREIELGWSAPEVQALEEALQDILDEE